jgi:hypothetical protein
MIIATLARVMVRALLPGCERLATGRIRFGADRPLPAGAPVRSAWLVHRRITVVQVSSALDMREITAASCYRGERPPFGRRWAQGRG